MIKFLRVDHRLLHGQVAVSWFNGLDVNTILVANDSVATDEFRKSAIRMAKPDNAKLVMKSVAESVEAINSGVTDKYNMLVVVESVEDAAKLINETKAIDSLNLGGTKQREGTSSYSKAVNLTEAEVSQLHQLQESGIDVFIQQVPNEKKETFK
ncbi:PTS sugar transporter subunit IIB [Lactobacillus sp. YT155]|uniref:PTS sugar transporter subunit IIB n=1 Tax=Lactobacillus sp. YT155 TaxID=3060955 RepID=UPI00265EC19F|nr:PTS sugar transporter subunit IIB [Lactobacillus sp. YT155]MDO1604676.1 PTS sugar transporter subunit IIB [Lactobacillus sp. YT155]